MAKMPDSRLGTRTPSILLVDDSPSDIDLTLMALKRSGMNRPVTVKPNGKDALAWLVEVASAPGEPPAVALDLTILAGDAKGEIVSVRAVGMAGDPVMLLGVPGTLTVADGIPSVQLEP